MMPFSYATAGATTVLLVIVCVLMTPRRRERWSSAIKEETKPKQPTKLDTLCASLISALGDCVILPQHGNSFDQAVKSYWARQQWCSPVCIVRPGHRSQLCTAIALIKQEFDRQQTGVSAGAGIESCNIFAVRAGGHSPVPDAASVTGGILIDLSLFNEVTISEDRSTVVIGAGCRWKDVSQVLDAEGLAVAGGRNADVGVGGLTLGGGLSFFSPRVGMVCSNIAAYEVVLASGISLTVSSIQNPDLWRALKGGANNFGIVTYFTARCFKCANIWSGFLWMPSFQSSKVLRAFHDYVERSSRTVIDLQTAYDPFAAGPLTSFSFVRDIGMTVIATNLVHTSPPVAPVSASSPWNIFTPSVPWPTCWETSSFRSMFWLWNTCKIRSLTSATQELSALNPPGRRQLLAMTTVLNDLSTIEVARDAYLAGALEIKKYKLKDIVFTLVLQPILPEWARKGDPNPLGFDYSSPNLSDRLDSNNTPLVNVSFTINWAHADSDHTINEITKRAIDRIEQDAKRRGTWHRYKYLNYCAEWQDPFAGYGEGEKEWLRSVSRKYDPDALFQLGCRGGHKLFSPEEILDIVRRRQPETEKVLAGQV